MAATNLATLVSQAAPGAGLELRQVKLPDAELHLTVSACAYSPWDGAAAPAWPRVPGGVWVGSDIEGNQFLCGGFLPCGTCPPCQSAMHLACQQPLRSGWNAQGGLATHVQAARSAAFLAPWPRVPLEPDELASALALLAAAGLTYQAVASCGMNPGDNVVVSGPAGPGALPLRLLLALGLQPIWIASHEAAPAPSELEGVTIVSSCPAPADLPVSRIHLLDLRPSEQSIETWASLLPVCQSGTLLGPGPLPRSRGLPGLLGGQVALRWIRDLHPHLVLDLVSLPRSRRIAVAPWVQTLSSLAEAALAWPAFSLEGSERWPVFLSPNCEITQV